MSIALLAAIGISTPGARAAPDSPWRKMADRVFREVAQNADLPHAMIPFTMTEAGSGFLWLGGDAGMLRWDGYEFHDYPAEPGRPDGVRDTEISVLHRDAQRQLWAGTKSSGLARYDPAQDRLVCVGLTDSRCGMQHVGAIEDDGTGGLWVATASGLFRLDAAGRARGQWHHIASDAGSLPDDQVLAVLHDRHGVLWVGTRLGLAKSLDGGKTFAVVPLNGAAQAVSRLAAQAVSRLMEDSAGRLWIGTRQDGAYVIGADRRQAQVIEMTAPVGGTDTANEVTALVEIAPDRVWIGTYGSGIVEVDGTALRTRRIVHDALVPNSLDGDTVQSLYRDNSGHVWIGTSNGLSDYDPGLGTMTMFGHRGRPDGLPGESVMNLLATPNGSVWAGLQGNGFVVLDPDGRRAAGLAGHNVSLIALGPGGILLGTDGGLFAADVSGQHVRRLTVPGLGPTVDVRALRTVANTVWLGTREGGLWQLRLDTSGNITVLRSETTPRLTNPFVEAIAVAPDGRLAIGTDSGFSLLDVASGAMERILPDPANPRGLDSGVVGAFANDRRGRLWVATTSGLDVLEGRDKAGRPLFRRIGTADGLPSSAIDGLLVDRRGFIWASTDLGLAVIDPETLSVRALHRADGLAITNYWTDSAAVTQDGDLMFGGLGGLTIVRPEAALPWDYRPPVVFTTARIGSRTAPIGQGSGSSVVVPAGADSVALEFASLDFSAPSRNRYKYRLDGFDVDWIDTDAAHRVATYTNLPPGSYRLRLVGSNRDGLWSEPETTMQIQVLPAWYQTLWLHVAAACAGVLFLAALLRGWTAILRRRQRDLERQVAERTDELSISKLQLEHANAGLELRVTERTQALVERTAALEASEVRFRAWFNNAEDAVFVVQVELDGRFIYEAVNAAVERVFGIPTAAYPGRQPASVLPASYAATLLEHYREAAKGAPIQFESRFAAQHGERLLDSWIVPLRHPITGRVERLVGASRDITERRALESRLAQAQKLQALGGLAGGIAHDFNNILQAVAGAATLIEQRPDNPEKTQRLARSTIAAVERGTSITRRLLAFARSDELRVEAMPTVEVLEGLSEVLTHTLGGAITVNTAFAKELPPLLADRGQLETALVNLGTNARDAMPHGGVLTLSAEPEQVTEAVSHSAGLAPGRYVRIDVADTGCGLDSAMLARVVEPFFTTKPPGQGTGLGLALVKGFTEQSGGGMAIESTQGVGTMVRLWLRQAAAGSLQSQAEAASDRIAGAASARILVVDDDDLVRETLAEQLERGGFDVLAAASGDEGLAAIQSSGPPDALVCDLSMPGMNGIDMIKRARAMLPGLPCFLLTGYAGERGALETGNAFTLLRKPISTSALIAQIDAGLAAGRR